MPVRSLRVWDEGSFLLPFEVPNGTQPLRLVDGYQPHWERDWSAFNSRHSAVAISLGVKRAVSRNSNMTASTEYLRLPVSNSCLKPSEK